VTGLQEHRPERRSQDLMRVLMDIQSRDNYRPKHHHQPSAVSEQIAHRLLRHVKGQTASQKRSRTGFFPPRHTQTT